MKMHVLITPKMAQVQPKTTKVVMSFGQLTIVVDNDRANIREGLHCIVEDTDENIQQWVDECDEFVKGSGTPQFESFTLMS